MGLFKMIRRNYFNVDNKYLAGGIHFITQQRYYKFTNDNGRECYSFEWTIEVEQAYNELIRLRKILHK